MKKKESFDRNEASELLPEPDTDLISAESLTLGSTSYTSTREKILDKAEDDKRSAIELIDEKRIAMAERRMNKPFNPYRPHSSRSLAKASAYGPAGGAASKPVGVTGQGAEDVPSPVDRLLKLMGINIELQFTRKNTQELIGVLLTCSEEQLDDLQRNRNVPVMVKTIIKSILEDYKNGSMTTVDRLWNRLFGPSFAEQPQQQGQSTTINVLSVVPGIGAGTKPISREGYALISKHVFGSDEQVVEEQ